MQNTYTGTAIKKKNYEVYIKQKPMHIESETKNKQTKKLSQCYILISAFPS